MVAVEQSERKGRLSADERRRQLLRVAKSIVLEHGAPAMTMERLADEAGVSKALPYKHFENSDQVLTELYRRETFKLGRNVWLALENTPAGVDSVRVGISAYLDEIVARCPVLAALAKPGTTMGAAADRDQVAVRFEVDILSRHHKVDRERAKQIAGIVQGAVVGAAGTLLADLSTRQQLEDDLVDLIHCLIDA